MPYGVVFCGTPEFAVPSLAALTQDPDFLVHRVFCQPDRISGRGRKLKPSPVKNWALEHHLEVATPERISKEEIISEIKQKKWEIAIVVAFGQILSQEFLDAFSMGCFNVHSSLLPRWRGAAPMERAIMAGDSQTGVSLQKIVKKLDAGELIGFRKFNLTRDVGAGELYEKLSHLGAKLLAEDLKFFLKGKLKATAQDENRVSYAPKILKKEAWIDWKSSAFEIHNKIRGLDRGNPFASTHYRKKVLKILKSQCPRENYRGSPGEIVDLKDESLVVSCGQGVLEIFIVQPESRAKMKTRDFICGYHPKKGEILE